MGLRRYNKISQCGILSFHTPHVQRNNILQQESRVNPVRSTEYKHNKQNTLNLENWQWQQPATAVRVGKQRQRYEWRRADADAVVDPKRKFPVGVPETLSGTNVSGRQDG